MQRSKRSGTYPSRRGIYHPDISRVSHESVILPTYIKILLIDISHIHQQPTTTQETKTWYDARVKEPWHLSQWKHLQIEVK